MIPVARNVREPSKKNQPGSTRCRPGPEASIGPVTQAPIRADEHARAVHIFHRRLAANMEHMMSDENNSIGLDGSTLVLPIIGDPIAQVKSPANVTRSLHERGINAIVIPIHVVPADVHAFVDGMSLARNVPGIIVTVPHKFASYQHCTTATERAHFLGAVNVLRRNADGSWHGDMFDGMGFVGGMRAAGVDPAGKRALLVGAGGAGSAIAVALLDSGVTTLAIHDQDAQRRDGLIERLRTRRPHAVTQGSPDPAGFELIVNATPVGMKAGDPYPVLVERLEHGMFVGDVITAPLVSPLVEAARRIGCRTQIGTGMFNAELDLMVDFLTEGLPTVVAA
jgi:shikimate dehydrogenase